METRIPCPNEKVFFFCVFVFVLFCFVFFLPEKFESASHTINLHGLLCLLKGKLNQKLACLALLLSTLSCKIMCISSANYPWNSKMAMDFSRPSILVCK